MMTAKERRLVAQLLAGMQVPVSMGLAGTAREPWVELIHLYNIHGWNDAEAIELAMAQKQRELEEATA